MAPKEKPKSRFRGVYNNGWWYSGINLSSVGGKALQNIPYQSTDVLACHARDKVAWAAFGEEADIQLPDMLTDEVKAALDGKGFEEVLEEIRKSSEKFSRGESAYRGVSKAMGKWSARVRLPGRKRVQKQFSSASDADELAAARWYDRMQLQHCGSSAKMNFPLTDYVRGDGPGPHATEESSQVHTAALAAGKPGAEAEVAAIEVARVGGAGGAAALEAAAGAATLVAAAGVTRQCFEPAQQQLKKRWWRAPAGSAAAAGSGPTADASSAGAAAGAGPSGGASSSGATEVWAAVPGMEVQCSEEDAAMADSRDEYEDDASAPYDLKYRRLTDIYSGASKADWEEDGEAGEEDEEASSNDKGGALGDGSGGGGWRAPNWALRGEQDETYNPYEFSNSEEEAEHDELMAWAEELGVSEEAFDKVEEDGGLAILQEVRSIQAARKQQSQGPLMFEGRRVLDGPEKEGPLVKTGMEAVLAKVQADIARNFRRMREELSQHSRQFTHPNGSSDVEAIRRAYEEERPLFHDRLASMADMDVRDQYIVDMNMLGRMFDEEPSVRIIAQSDDEMEEGRQEVEDCHMVHGLPEGLRPPKIKHLLGEIFSEYGQAGQQQQQQELEEDEEQAQQHAQQRQHAAQEAAQLAEVLARLQAKAAEEEQAPAADGSALRERATPLPAPPASVWPGAAQAFTAPTPAPAAGSSGPALLPLAGLGPAAAGGVTTASVAAEGSASGFATPSFSELAVPGPAGLAALGAGALGEGMGPEMESLTPRGNDLLSKLSKLEESAKAGEDCSALGCTDWEARVSEAVQASNTAWLVSVLGPDWHTIVQERPIFGPHRPPPEVEDPYCLFGANPTPDQRESTWGILLEGGMNYMLDCMWHLHGAGAVPGAPMGQPPLQQQPTKVESDLTAEQLLGMRRGGSGGGKGSGSIQL